MVLLLVTMCAVGAVSVLQGACVNECNACRREPDKLVPFICPFLQCFEGHHRPVAQFGMAMLVVLGVVCPLLAALWLWLKRQHLDDWEFAWKVITSSSADVYTSAGWHSPAAASWCNSVTHAQYP